MQNPRVLYNLLFRAAAETLLTIAADPKHLGARIGFFGVLHTWGQNLHHHPHLHCVVPGGGLSLDRSRWIGSTNHFFLPDRVLSCLFRRKFRALLLEAYQQGQLCFEGTLAALAKTSAFTRLFQRLKKTDWVVHSEPPFGGPQHVLTYLSRYTHRVAISNARLLALEDGQVSFQWRDYRDGKSKVMTLSAVEFLRRFLQHILPPRFVKIRYFGLLANRSRRKNLERCRQLLSCAPPVVAESEEHESDRCCPACGQGILRIVEWFEALAVPLATDALRPLSRMDSS